MKMLFNDKRILCMSTINDDRCMHINKCKYAHTLDEQKVDHDRTEIIKLYMDADVLSTIDDEEIYKRLMLYTKVCESCINGQCMGGYNCKHGVNHKCIKICRNDFLSGDCVNATDEIYIVDEICKKFELRDNIKRNGCANGHHLTLRGLIPYCKFTHNQQYDKKYNYQSIRYIDINQVSRFLLADVHDDSISSPMSSDNELEELLDSCYYNSDDDKLQ